MSGDSGLHTVEGFIWHNEDSEYACIQSLLRSCDRGTNPNLRRLSSTNLSQTHSAITEGKQIPFMHINMFVHHVTRDI